MKKIAINLIILLGYFIHINLAYSEPVELSLNGNNLIGEHVVAEELRSTDKTILLLHGTLAHLGMETIHGLQEVLIERGYNTLSINLSFGLNKRTGMYDCDIPHRHLYSDALSEISGWLDWLGVKGVSDVTLFGHSRGGAQAALFGATSDHTLIKRLVLLAPATWNSEKVASGFKRTHGRELHEVLAEARSLVKKGAGAQFMKGTGILYCAGADVTADSFLSYYEPSSDFDTPSLIPRIKHPVLVVTGGQDEVVPHIAKLVKPLADGDAVTLVSVDDAGHFFLDLFAEDVADAIEEFDPPND